MITLNTLPYDIIFMILTRVASRSLSDFLSFIHVSSAAYRVYNEHQEKFLTLAAASLPHRTLECAVNATIIELLREKQPSDITDELIAQHLVLRLHPQVARLASFLFALQELAIAYPHLDIDVNTQLRSSSWRFAVYHYATRGIALSEESEDSGEDPQDDSVYGTKGYVTIRKEAMTKLIRVPIQMAYEQYCRQKDTDCELVEVEDLLTFCEDGAIVWRDLVKLLGGHIDGLWEKFVLGVERLRGRRAYQAEYIGAFGVWRLEPRVVKDGIEVIRKWLKMMMEAESRVSQSTEGSS